MSEIVGECDGDKRSEEVRVDLVSLNAASVEMKREEADGDMESFARDFVPVNEATPVSMDWDQAQGARRSTEVSPEGRACGRRRQVTIRGSGRERCRF